jgi:hypothetical protein
MELFNSGEEDQASDPWGSEDVVRSAGMTILSTLLHLRPLRFHCVGGYWDRTPDCCDFGIDRQRL